MTNDIHERDTGTRTESHERRALLRRIEIGAELATLAKRPINDSGLATTALFTIAQIALCAVIAALYVALH
jgi:hypothetical protein